MLVGHSTPPPPETPWRRTSLMLLALALAATSCSRKEDVKVVEGYRVTGHDARTGEWEIIRNGTFEGKYLVKRMTALCSFVIWGDRGMARGPDACDLRVGEMMVPNPVPKDGSDFLDISEKSGDTLAITKGRGPDRILQEFTILKYEVLP